MTDTQITLFVEDFLPLVKAAESTRRFPALERLFSRGYPSSLPAVAANHVRFALFGIVSDEPVPVAALTHIADRDEPVTDNYYWLRTDPVTLWADMARVFMTSYGFADLNPYERNEIEICIRSVLIEEGIDLHAEHPERWCIALKDAPGFEFTELDDALGMDLADALPGHDQARYWRRLLTEIQVALHNCPVNVRRRQSGRQEINSVWFWGGGLIPAAAEHDLVDTVYSDHPVSRGLAIINDCRLKCQQQAMKDDFEHDGRTILIDWVPVSRYAQEELENLERLAQQLLRMADQGELELQLYMHGGAGRRYNRKSRRRFWKRNIALHQRAAAAE